MHVNSEIYNRCFGDDAWYRKLYASALRCREQDGEDEALEELRSLAAGLGSAARNRDLWRL